MVQSQRGQQKISCGELCRKARHAEMLCPAERFACTDTSTCTSTSIRPKPYAFKDDFYLKRNSVDFWS